MDSSHQQTNLGLKNFLQLPLSRSINVKILSILQNTIKMLPFTKSSLSGSNLSFALASLRHFSYTMRRTHSSNFCLQSVVTLHMCSSCPHLTNFPQSTLLSHHSFLTDLEKVFIFITNIICANFKKYTINKGKHQMGSIF